jgi:hypothetical protein
MEGISLLPWCVCAPGSADVAHQWMEMAARDFPRRVAHTTGPETVIMLHMLGGGM